MTDDSFSVQLFLIQRVSCFKDRKNRNKTIKRGKM